jgi:phosphoribosyl 1,2-cyclic phosphodiesterase
MTAKARDMLLTEVAGNAVEADAADPDAAGRHSRTPCWPNTGSARSPGSQGGQARHLPSGTGVTHRALRTCAAWNPAGIEAIVCGHGHVDHATGLPSPPSA